MSGLSRTPGKRVWVNSPPRVRIPLAPPKPIKNAPSARFFMLASMSVSYCSLGLS